MKQLAKAREAHRPRVGKLAQPNLPIFQAGINVYVKSVTESQVNAIDILSARLEKKTCNVLATNG